jgi:hypothetical protein
MRAKAAAADQHLSPAEPEHETAQRDQTRQRELESDGE